MKKLDYVLGSTTRELERLITQSQILEPITERLMRQAGLGQGMRVLDLGCGAGDLSFLAVKMVGPLGKVIGIDRASTAISVAKDRASQNGYETADFYVTSVEEFSSTEPFDFVIGRYVLIHQPSPSAFIRTARRHVREGGVIAFHEISLHRGYHCLPPVSVWEQMEKWLNIGFQAGAPSWDAAGRLVEHFLQAGLPCPEMFAEMPVGGGTNSPIYKWLAETVRSLMPRLLELRAVIEKEVSIETLEERLRAGVIAVNAQVDVATQVCAWAKTKYVETRTQ